MAQADNHVVLQGSERRPVAGARRVGAAGPNAQLTVSVRLRPRPDASNLPSPADLGARAVSERRHMSREEFGASYGADPSDIAKVESFAREYGLAIVERSRGSRNIVVSGTVEAMSRASAVEAG